MAIIRKTITLTIGDLTTSEHERILENRIALDYGCTVDPINDSITIYDLSEEACKEVEALISQ